MPAVATQLLLGALAAAIVASLAWWRRALTAGGALAAVFAGALVVGGGGWWWGVLLVGFFATASALSRWRPRSRRPEATVTVRGARRDAVQVLANGGVAVLLASVALVRPDAAAALFPAFAGAVAAANADTWATELGRFSRAQPRLITTGAPVIPGVSGGVTMLGSLGAAAGGLLIGLIAAGGAAAGWAPGTPGPLLIAVSLGGLAGALGDSVLGATLQASYTDAHTGAVTERPRLADGRPNPLRRGLPWLTNDGVNGAATVIGALGAALVSSLLVR